MLVEVCPKFVERATQSKDRVQAIVRLQAQMCTLMCQHFCMLRVSRTLKILHLSLEKLERKCRHVGRVVKDMNRLLGRDS